VLKVVAKPDWRGALTLQETAGREQKTELAAMLAELFEPSPQNSAALSDQQVQQAAVQPANKPQPAKAALPQEIASVLKL